MTEGKFLEHFVEGVFSISSFCIALHSEEWYPTHEL